MRFAAASVALALALPAAQNGEAHAFLDHAEPKVGAKVRAPAEVRLWFTQGVVPTFCRVAVAGPPGFGGVGPLHPIAGSANGLAVDLRAPTPTGDYVVRWRVISVDTHETQGSFGFEVTP